jgi:hypothetical protein
MFNPLHEFSKLCLTDDVKITTLSNMVVNVCGENIENNQLQW